MKKINLSISGCMGRMGQQLIKSSKKNKNFKLVSLTENRLINKKIAGLKPSKNSVEAFKKSNVIIDFTVPKCTLEILKIASKLKKKVVICDRFIDSTIAYQVYGKKVDIKFINNIHKKILGKIKPNLVFILKVSAKSSKLRLKKRKSKKVWNKFK